MLQLRGTCRVPAGLAAVCLWAGFTLASEVWAVALSSHWRRGRKSALPTSALLEKVRRYNLYRTPLSSGLQTCARKTQTGGLEREMGRHYCSTRAHTGQALTAATPSNFFKSDHRSGYFSMYVPQFYKWYFKREKTEGKSWLSSWRILGHSRHGARGPAPGVATGGDIYTGVHVAHLSTWAPSSGWGLELQLPVLFTL